MRDFVSSGFLAPPMLFVVSCLLGALIALFCRRTGIVVVLNSTICLYVLATPAFSSFLAQQLETKIPADNSLATPQAIVVLGADVRSGNRTVPDRLGPLSLERLVFAAEAYRQWRLPVLVSGGRILDWQNSVARLMKTTLEDVFAVPVAWSEERSQQSRQAFGVTHGRSASYRGSGREEPTRSAQFSKPSRARTQTIN
jgi:uncharacterized SAM-binding protein YcdF (DUF218 family)